MPQGIFRPLLPVGYGTRLETVQGHNQGCPGAGRWHWSGDGLVLVGSDLGWGWSGKVEGGGGRGWLMVNTASHGQ